MRKNTNQSAGKPRKEEPSAGESPKKDSDKVVIKNDLSTNESDCPVNAINTLAIVYITACCMVLGTFSDDALTPHWYLISILLLPFCFLYFFVQRYYIRKMELKEKTAMLCAHQQAVNAIIDNTAKHLATFKDSGIDSEIQKEFIQLAIQAHASPLTENSNMSLFKSSKK